MKSRSTLILIVVALVVGGLVYLDYRKGTPTNEAASQRNRLLKLKAADVTRLEIVRTNQTIVLERTGTQWNMKKPLAVRADDSAVNSILDEVEFAERTRTLTGTAPAEFGVDAPRIRLSIQDKDGITSLRVGSETPTKDAVYVKVGDEKDIVVVRKSMYERLDRSVDDLRDRTVIGYVADSATRLEIKNAERVMELAKTASATNAEPRWAFVRPLTVRADQQKTRQLLSDLGNLRVLDFVSEDPKDLHTFRLDEPTAEVTVWTGAADTGKTLLIGVATTNDATKVIAKRKGADSIFTISADEAKKFVLQINDLRARQVLTFDEPAVRTVELVRGSDKLAVTRDTGPEGGWRVTAPVAMAADATHVQDLLTKLSDLQVLEFVADVATDVEKYGLVTPAAAVTLQGEGTNVVAQLLVGSVNPSNTWRYVKRADEPSVYGVDTNMVAWLPANALAVRTRKLADLKPDQITKLTIETGAQQYVLERDAEKKWKLVQPVQGALDVEGLNSLLNAFTQLRAQEFVREGLENLAQYGLDAPTLTVAAMAGDKTYRLTVGKQLSDAQKYAAWSDPALVFTVSTTDLGALTTNILAAPTPPAVAPPAGSPSAPAQP